MTSLLRIEKHIPGCDASPDTAAGAPTLDLPFAERSRSRLRVTLSNGVEAAVFLPRGTVLRGGDVLQAEDGTVVAVRAAPEQLIVVSASDRLTLMRAAYHLGNRHVAVEIGENHLKLERDPVLADMLRGLGANVEERSLPFEPDAGAYGGGHRHGHDATFEADYALAQNLFQSHVEAGHPLRAADTLRYPPRPGSRRLRSK